MFSFMSKKSDRHYPVATRVVKNSRWIHRDQLAVGMYVSELDVPWEQTNFLFQGFFIRNEKQLHDVKSASEWVLIESEKVAKVSADSTGRLCGVTRGANSWS